MKKNVWQLAESALEEVSKSDIDKSAASDPSSGHNLIAKRNAKFAQGGEKPPASGVPSKWIVTSRDHGTAIGPFPSESSAKSHAQKSGMYDDAELEDDVQIFQLVPPDKG